MRISDRSTLDEELFLSNPIQSLCYRFPFTPSLHSISFIVHSRWKCTNTTTDAVGRRWTNSKASNTPMSNLWALLPVELNEAVHNICLLQFPISNSFSCSFEYAHAGKWNSPLHRISVAVDRENAPFGIFQYRKNRHLEYRYGRLGFKVGSLLDRRILIHVRICPARSITIYPLCRRGHFLFSFTAFRGNKHRVYHGSS